MFEIVHVVPEGLGQLLQPVKLEPGSDVAVMAIEELLKKFLLQTELHVVTPVDGVDVMDRVPLPVPPITVLRV